MPSQSWCPACQVNVVPRWSPEERAECPRCANPLEPSFLAPEPPPSDTDPSSLASEPNLGSDLDALESLLAATRSRWRTLSSAAASVASPTHRPAPIRVRIDPPERAVSATRPAAPPPPPRPPLTARDSADGDNFAPDYWAEPRASRASYATLPAVVTFLGVLLLGMGAVLVVCGQFQPLGRLVFLGELVTLGAQLVLLLGIVGLIQHALRRAGGEVSAHTATLVDEWRGIREEWKSQHRRRDEPDHTVPTPTELRRRLDELAREIDRLAG